MSLPELLYSCISFHMSCYIFFKKQTQIKKLKLAKYFLLLLERSSKVLQYNPMHVCSVVGTVAFSGAYSQKSVYKIVDLLFSHRIKLSY